MAKNAEIKMAEPHDAILERIRASEALRLGREVGQEKYRATDPASQYVRCGCGRPECWTAGLLPLRAHSAALFRAIVALGVAEVFDGCSRQDDPWPGVIFSLQMAGGLDDLFADPSYVYDDEASLYCESVADREDEDWELASKYVAALITFNFAWTAYEAAIEISVGDAYIKDKLPVRARKIFQIEADKALKVTALEASYLFARRVCGREDPLKAEIALVDTKYALTGAAAAAELARIFRNHVIHGREELPAQSVMPCYRLYAITRLLLLLIQQLVLRTIKNADQMVNISCNLEHLGKEPAGLFLRNLHYIDERWRTAIPKSSIYGRTTRWFAPV